MPLRLFVSPSPRWPLVLGMVGAVAIAVTLTVWDLEREALGAVESLTRTTGSLAIAMAQSIDRGLSLDERLVRSLDTSDGTAYFLVERGRIVEAAGRPVESAAIHQLVQQSGRDLLLGRDEAQALGLPPHRAVAVRAPLAGGRTLVVVSTAAPERALARHGEWLVTVSIAAVALVAVALGSAALRREAQRLVLAHEVDRTRLERERDEQLSRADRIAVASALSMGVAHELATPLSVISARVEQLDRAAADDKARGALATISEQTEHMRRIMQGFLAFARGDAPLTASVAPEDLVRQATRAVRHRFANAGLGLELEMDDALPHLSADALLLQQALANVLINAAQASPRGTRVVLRVSAERDSVLFDVLDAGAGVDAAILARLTRPFVTTRATSGGTGLGLAITSEILRHHGGRLELHPRPEGGLSARLVMPYAAREPS